MVVCLVLCDLRSAQNVGSLFRTSDAIGVSRIILAGYTPAPIDRFGRKRQDIAKASLGAEDSVSWEVEENAAMAIEKLHSEEFYIVAIEQSENSIDYKKIPQAEKIAFVLGNEVLGLDLELLKQCNCIAEIPMRGKKESLNVAVAGAIILARYCDL